MPNYLYEYAKRVQEAHESLTQVLRPVAELCSNIEQSLAPVCEIIEKRAELIGAVVTRISPAFLALHETFERLPPRVQKALTDLADNGWFFDFGNGTFPQLFMLQELMEQGDYERIEQYLVDYYETHLGDIEAFLIEQCPHRAKVLRAAFDAHRNGEYELSTLAFLSQVDGICRERIGFQYFIKRNERPQTAQYVDQFTGTELTGAVLSLLAHPAPIGYSEKQRGESFSELNRHMIMHGESLDYGTKINSLKSLSLVNYVAQAVGIPPHE